MEDEGWTMVPIKPSTKNKLKEQKGKITFDDEINKLLEIKEKVQKGERVTSKTLEKINAKRFKE